MKEKNYEYYLKGFFTNRRSMNLHENLDILEAPPYGQLVSIFSNVFFSGNGEFELVIMDGKNGKAEARCFIKGIEILAVGGPNKLILKIKFTMVRQKKDGKLQRRGHEYSIFEDSELIKAEAIYISELKRGYVETVEVIG